MANERKPLTNPITGAPLSKREQPGYYPGFSTLKQKRYWDAATRKVDRGTSLAAEADSVLHAG